MWNKLKEVLRGVEEKTDSDEFKKQINETKESINKLEGIEDRFILMNSGSAAGDGGIIVQTEVASSGSAFVYDDTGTRWGFQQGTKLAQDASTSTPDAYAAAVVTSDDANYQKNGNIRVESGEIYIYIE